MRKRRYPSIEIARGLAATCVVLYHVGGHLGQTDPGPGVIPNLLGTLSIGVQVFFAISGFVIGLPFVESLVHGKDIRYGSYLVRRITRILPAYWVALTILAIYPGLNGVFSHDWWKYYSLTHIYGVHREDGLLVSWTLAVEMSFYLLLPVAAWLLARGFRRLTPNRRGIWLLILLVFTGVLSLSYGQLRFHLGETPAAVNWSLFTLAGTWVWFVPGLMLATLMALPQSSRWAKIAHRVDAHRSLPWVSATVLVVSTAALTAWLSRFHPDYIPESALRVLVGSSSIVLMIHLRRFTPTRALGLRLVGLGTISYAVYLWHEPLIIAIKIVLGIGSHGSFGLILGVFVLTMIVTIPIAALSWVLLERPINRAAARLTRSPSPVVTLERPELV